MKQTIYKFAAIGIALSTINCTPKHKNLQVTNTYMLQSCDKEEKVYFVEMQEKSDSFTGFIDTKNKNKLQITQQKFKIGTHTTYEIAKAHFDGIYPTHE